jgi:hypothetical protein
MCPILMIINLLCLGCVSPYEDVQMNYTPTLVKLSRLGTWSVSYFRNSPTPVDLQYSGCGSVVFDLQAGS